MTNYADSEGRHERLWADHEIDLPDIADVIEPRIDEAALGRAWEAWTAHRQQLDRQANERAAVEREAW